MPDPSDPATPAGFEELGLSEPIRRALGRAGYERPTPIQEQAIPAILAGRDVLGLAQTGTGKTAAFLLPVIERLRTGPAPAEPDACRALVLVPTRELASQVGRAVQTYARGGTLRSVVAYGGVPKARQAAALRDGTDLLVGTPGRLLDLAADGTLRLFDTGILVLDEADRMLSLGFAEQVLEIAALLPRHRQTLLFSATMEEALLRFAAPLLHKPVRIEAAPPATTATGLRQQVAFVEPARKPSLLGAILRRPDIGRALVFVRTKQAADSLVAALSRDRIKAEAIHGDRSQGQRERTLAAFRKGTVTVLVATDVAARGLDVDNITHVVNFDMPEQPDSYVHRIGRTARAGAEGVAISFCSVAERGMLREIEKLTRSRISVVEPGMLVSG